MKAPIFIPIALALLGGVAGQGWLVAAPALSAGASRGVPGALVTMPVRLSGVDAGRPVVGLQFDVRFDAAVLSPTTVAGSGTAASHRLEASVIAPGVERVLLYSSNNAAVPAGLLANLSFTIATNAVNGASFITLTNVILADGQAVAVTPATLARGTNTVFGAPDRVRPRIAITRPASGQVITNATTLLAGTASDMNGLGQVLFSLNGAGFQPAAGTAKWSNQIALVPGTNTVVVKAVDFVGNESLPATRRFFRRVRTPLGLAVGAGGRVSGATNGQLLDIGRGYRLTAVESNGWLFSHWSGSASAAETTLRFLMQTGFSVTANFVTNRFLALHGSYNGLFAETNVVAQESAGCFIATVASKGAYSGSLRIGSQRHVFSGKFGVNGATTNSVRRGTNTALTLVMTVTGDTNASWIMGTVNGSGWTAELRAHRAVFNARTRPAPYAGRYTVLVPGGVTTGTTNTPGGDSFGAVTVAAGGATSLSGSLADGTVLGLSAPVSPDGWWPVYAGLYGGRGSVWSWLLFDTNQPGSDVAGEWRWIKPASAPGAKYYPAGFTSWVDAAGSMYRVPLGNTNRVLEFSNGLVVFSGGNLSNAFTNRVTLVPGGKVTNTSTNKLTFTVVKPSGLFNGTVVVPETGKTQPFKGALFTKGTNGAGYFLGTNASGRVRFGPGE